LIQPKYDEFELTNILDDNNWKKLGFCSIECISCIDYTPPTKTSKKAIVENNDRMNEVNEQIKLSANKSKKPKTPAQLIEEQTELMKGMAKEIADLKKDKKPIAAPLEPAGNSILVEQYVQLFGKNPHPKMKDETMKAKIDEKLNN